MNSTVWLWAPSAKGLLTLGNVRLAQRHLLDGDTCQRRLGLAGAVRAPSSKSVSANSAATRAARMRADCWATAVSMPLAEGGEDALRSGHQRQLHVLARLAAPRRSRAG